MSPNITCTEPNKEKPIFLSPLEGGWFHASHSPQPLRSDAFIPVPEVIEPGTITVDGEKFVMPASDERMLRDAFGIDDDDGVSIISVLGQIAVLTVNSNCISRQILWDQTTETMQLAVHFAPIIAKCVQLSWEHQGEITQIEGDKEITSGRMMSIAGGIGLATGVMKYKSEVEEAATKEADAALEEAKEAGREEEFQAEQAAERAAESSKSWGTKVKEFFTKGNGVKHIMKGAFKSLETSLGMIQGSAALSKWTVEGPADIQESQEKRTVGQYEAKSKEGDGFMAYWNSSTSRTQQTQTDTDRNVPETLQIYKSASDQITNVEVSAYGKV